LACACALALGSSAFVLGASAAQSQPDDPSWSARGLSYGLYAEVYLSGTQVLSEEPMPTAECPPDDEDSLANIDLVEGAITVEALEVACTTDDEGVVNASAAATNVEVNLEPGIEAELLEAECSANGEPVGDATVVGLKVFGEPVAVSGEPNQVIDLPLVKLTINRQEEPPSGAPIGLRVDALVLEFDSGEVEPGLADGTLIVISSVYCAPSSDEEPAPTTTTTTPTTPTTAAPAAPAPVAPARPTFTG
jgi:hypothetical protein